MKPKFLLLLFFYLGLLKANSQTVPGPTQKLFFEKVYLHVDREYYSKGEDIWFKAYLLNAQVNQLLNTSNNLYVELLSPDAKIVDRRMIRLEEGIGLGDFKLGDSISSGAYRIRAYTNWMRNFGDNFVFEKQILINGITKDSKTSKTSLAGNAATSRSTENPKSSSTIQFFPEGGSMIEGVSGIVAYKAESSKGKGVKVKGSIVSSSGDTVTNFESKDLGLGSFMFMPLSGTKYYAKGNFDNNTPFTVSLPAALPAGFSLYIQNTDTTKVRVIISTNQLTLNEYKGREFELRVRHTGISYFSVKFALNDAQSIVEISKNGIPAGIAAITLTDDKGRPHCERLIYIDHAKNNIKLSIKTNQPTYKSKERVVVTVKAFDNANKPVKANLSLAVIDDAMVPVNKGNIISYMMLESELKGKIEKPEQYFDATSTDRLKKLDLLLLTQGWRDFIWKRLKDTTLKISYINEVGFTVSGKVREKSADKPLPGVNVTLFANGAKGDRLLSTKTDAQGKYYFDRVNLEGNQSLKLVSVDNKGKKAGMILLDSLLASPLPAFPVNFSNEDISSYLSFKKLSDLRLEEMKKFDLSDTISLKEVEVKGSKTVQLFEQTATTFGYPDQNFIITEKDHDYTNLSHFLSHRVAGAIPDTGGSNGVKFVSDGKKVNPRFIVDKREDLFERLDYYDLPMNQIQKVTVRHLIGTQSQGDSTSIASSGGPLSHVYLIYLTLKPTAFVRKELSLLNANVTGYYQQRLFYAPSYPTGITSSKVDLRTTIYWHPLVNTDETGSATIYFNNADPKGKMRLVVEGVTEKGIPVAGIESYQVK